MQMSHFSTDLLTGFHKPTPNPTRFPNPGFHDSEDRLSSTSNAKSQPLIPPRHVAPSSPYDKDPMFEKPLTPSDVGKLNRLVIPKQHAEKYFPLGGAGDAAGGLLGFEDEAGKCWQFRYSYWNSSQSYVLTKGWSRYVKEKGLDAGDVVFFERHRSEPNRLFIGWRRRGTAPIQQPGVRYNAPGYGVAQDSVLGLNLFQSDFRRHTGGRGGTGREEEEQGGSGDAGGTNSNSPRLVRLFGVNLECSQTTSSRVSSHPIQLQQQQQQQEEGFRHYFNYMGHHHHHMLMGELMDGGSDK